MRFELTTPTLARLCSTPELRPLKNIASLLTRWGKSPLALAAGERYMAQSEEKFKRGF